jgi:hypothetical protein
MTATLRIQLIATGAEAVTVQVLQAQPSGEPLIISDHRLLPGEIHHATVTDAQRIVVIEPAPCFADQLARYRATAPAPSSQHTNAAVLDELARIESDTRTDPR